MAIATARAEETRPVVLADIEDLDRFRASLVSKTARQPVILTFDTSDRTVYLGIADRLGFVHVAPMPDQPPYFITSGDPAREGTVEFFLHGEHHTEIAARHLVPVELAWSAVREFLISHDLWPSVRWDEV